MLHATWRFQKNNGPNQRQRWGQAKAIRAGIKLVINVGHLFLDQSRARPMIKLGIRLGIKVWSTMEATLQIESRIVPGAFWETTYEERQMIWNHIRPSTQEETNINQIENGHSVLHATWRL